MRAATDDTVWFHHGTDPVDRPGEQYIHLGTREAALRRRGGTREPYAVHLTATAPLNGPDAPLSDIDANRLDMYDAAMRELGRAPVPEDFDEDFTDCAAIAAEQRWSVEHDVIYYWNVCEGIPSLPVMARSSTLRRA